MIDLLPRHARFSERARVAPKIVLPVRPPAFLFETLLAPPAPPTPYPAIVVPLPGDLIQIIQQGVGRVPSVFASYQNIAPPPAGGGLSIYLRSPTTTYQLPASPALDDKVTVKDASGTATAAPITISTVDGLLIDDQATAVINQNFAALGFSFNGVGWSIV